jgi:hypothetical protein
MSAEHRRMHVTAKVEPGPAKDDAELGALCGGQMHMDRGVSRAQTSQGLVSDVARMQAGLIPVIINSSSGGRRAMHLDEVGHLSSVMDSEMVQIMNAECCSLQMAACVKAVHADA